MPTVSYDFNEAGDFADFVVLEAGNYVFEFKSAEASKSKAGNPKVVVDLVVTAASPGNSWAVGGLLRQHWATKGGGSGRFRDFLAALGYNFKEKGSLKLEKYYGEEVGARVTKKPGEQLDEEGNPMYFNELRQLMPGEQMRTILGAAADEAEDEEYEEEELEEEELEDEEEPEEEEDEEIEDEEEEDEEDDEEEDIEEDEEELTLDDLDDMSLAELKELAEEYDISTKPAKGKKRVSSALMRKRLAVLWEEEEEDEDEDEEDPF